MGDEECVIRVDERGRTTIPETIRIALGIKDKKALLKIKIEPLKIWDEKKGEWREVER